MGLNVVDRVVERGPAVDGEGFLGQLQLLHDGGGFPVIDGLAWGVAVENLMLKGCGSHDFRHGLLAAFEGE